MAKQVLVINPELVLEGLVFAAAAGWLYVQYVQKTPPPPPSSTSSTVSVDSNGILTAKMDDGNILISRTLNSDDSAVIQAAVDNSATVLIKSANYILNAPISIRQPVAITGEGIGTKLSPSADGITAFSVQSNDVAIKNLYVNQRGTGTGRGVLVPSAHDRLTFQNLRIDNAWRGIDVLSNCNSVTISDNVLINCGRDTASILVTNSNSPSSTISITNNLVMGSLAHGIQVFSSTAAGIMINQVTVTDNVVNNPIQAGIWFAGCKNGTVLRNRVTGAGAESLDFEYCDTFTIQNNEVQDARGNGLSLFAGGGIRCTNFNVNGNTINMNPSSTVAAVAFQSASAMTFSLNQVKASTDGIFIWGSASDNIIIQNNASIQQQNVGQGQGIRVDPLAGNSVTGLHILSNKITGFYWGINFNPGIIDGVDIINNDLTGNTNLAIRFGVTPTNLVVSGNTGYP